MNNLPYTNQEPGPSSHNMGYLVPGSSDNVWMDLTGTRGDEEVNQLEDISFNDQKETDHCLVINETLEVLVRDMIATVDSEIATVKDMEEFLSHQLCFAAENGASLSEDKPFGIIMSSYKKSSELIRKRPYIRTKNGETPPPNLDESDRISRGEFNIYDIRRGLSRTWTPDNVTHLERGVGDSIREVKLATLYRQKEGLLQKLSQAESQAEYGRLDGEHERVVVLINKLKAASSRLLAAECSSDQMADTIDWIKISLVDMRGLVSERNCRLAWLQMFNPAVCTSKWTKSEDEQLAYLVDQHGLHSWEIISRTLGTQRTAFSCLQRWQTKVSPLRVPKKSIWSPEEDECLLEMVLKVMDSPNSSGIICWSTVAAQLECRTSVECRRRWSLLDPTIRNGPFKEEEDLQLLLAVQRYGTICWNRVAASLPGRRVNMCRQRYDKLLETLQPWTYFEDKRLFFLMSSWSQSEFLKRCKSQGTTLKDYFRTLLPHFPGRYVRSIRQRWRTLVDCMRTWQKLKKAVGANITTFNEVRDGQWCPRDVLKVLLRTPFVANLVNQFSAQGIPCAEENVLEMISTWQAPFEGQPELTEMLNDFKQGIVIPRPVLSNIDKPCSKQEFHIKMTHIKRLTENKLAIQANVRQELERIHRQEYDSMSTKKRQRLEQILGDDSLFWIALEMSLRNSNVSKQFFCYREASAMLKLIPEIARSMLVQPRTCTENSHRDKAEHSASLHPELRLPRMKLMKLNQIRRLLHQRSQAVTAFSKQGQCGVLRYVPKAIGKYLKQPNVLESNQARITQMFQRTLRHGEDKSIVDQSSEETINADLYHQVDSIPPVPPNYATLLCFKTLLMEQTKLSQQSRTFGQSFQHSVQETDPEQVEGQNSNWTDTTSELSESRSSNVNRTIDSLLDDPRYRLLQARIMALVGWPAILSTLSPQHLRIAVKKLTETKQLDGTLLFTAKKRKKMDQYIKRVPRKRRNFLRQDPSMYTEHIASSNHEPTDIVNPNKDRLHRACKRRYSNIPTAATNDSTNMSFSLSSGIVVTLPRDVITLVAAGFSLETLQFGETCLDLQPSEKSIKLE